MLFVTEDDPLYVIRFFDVFLAEYPRDEIEVCALSHQLPGPSCPERVRIPYLPGKSRLTACTLHRRMLVDAIGKRDILLVQGGVLVVAAGYVLFNLVADVLQRMLDPRIAA